jgi:hypothetical protein
MNQDNTQKPQDQGQAQSQPTQPTPPPPPPPPADMTGFPGMGTPPPTEPEDNTPANFQLGQLFTDGIKLKLPEHPETKFDDDQFISLLASSISLSKAEKKRIVDAIPKLKQWQVDELMNIFTEEKQKFAQLSKKHVPQLEKLAKQHYEEWRDLELGQEQVGKSEEDKAKAEEIRKSLGL